MTITLDPDTEARLCEKAVREGQDINALASTLLNRALVWEAQDRAKAVEGIRRGLKACEQGRSRLFREFAAEQHAKFNLLLQPKSRNLLASARGMNGLPVQTCGVSRNVVLPFGLTGVDLSGKLSV